MPLQEKNLKKLKYDNKSSAPSFGKKSPGNLDVGRFVQSKPAFRKNSNSNIECNKKIVFCDWSINGWDEYKRISINLQCREWLNQGYSLYYLNNKQIIEITHASLSFNRPFCEEVFRNCAFLTPESIHKLAVRKLKCAPREIFLFDYYAVNEFFDEALAPGEVRVLDILAATDKSKPLSNIGPLIKHALHSPTTIVCENMDPYLVIVRELTGVEKIFQTKKYRYHLCKFHGLSYFKFTSQKNADKQTTSLSEAARFSDGQPKNHMVDFNYLEYSSVRFFLGESYFEENGALPRPDRLRTLNLNRSENVNSFLTELLSFKPNQLEYVDLSGSDIDTETLENFALQTPSLKILKLSDCQKINTMLEGDFVLGQLEYLDLSNIYSDVNLKIATSFLSRTPHLKTLKLSIAKGPVEDLEGEYQLNQLELLELQNELNSCISKTLALLSSKIPQLKSLKLIHPYAYGILPEIKVQLTQVVSLEFDCEGLLTQEHLKYIIESCPSLESLIYSNVSVKRLIRILSSIPSNLKSLTLSCYSNTSRWVSTLLAHTPQLEFLDLSGCKKLRKVFQGEYKLHQLKTINLSKTKISSAALCSLLSKTKRLKSLTLGSCNRLSEILAGDFDLPHLEFLDLRGSNIPNEVLDSLLAKVSNPESLEILTDSHHGKKNIPAYTRSLDCNTKYKKNKQFNLKRVFFSKNSEHPPLPLYRKTVFDIAGLGETLEHPFVIGNTEIADFTVQPDIKKLYDIQREFYNTKDGPKDKTYETIYGREKFSLTQEWQAIPSLSAHEKMRGYSVSPCDAKIEISYSHHDNLHYIRSASPLLTGPVDIDFEFLLEVLKAELDATQVDKALFESSLPEEIKTLIKKYKNSQHTRKLKINKKKASPEDYLNAIQEQKRGACRHLAFAFKMEMQEKHPNIPVRQVYNGCHAFLELKVDHKWYRVDLGGHPANLKINDENMPAPLPDFSNKHDSNENRENTLETSTEESNKTDQTFEPLQQEASKKNATAQTLIQSLRLNPEEQIKSLMQLFETWEIKEENPCSLLELQEKILADSQLPRKLFDFSSSDDIKAFIQSFTSYCHSHSRPFYIINSADDLVCSAPFLERHDNAGTLKKGPGGPLDDFLRLQEDKSNPPVLLNNYNNFDNDELVNFNSLLDDKGFADGTALPESCLIVGTINKEKPNCYEGSDFYSRFDACKKFNSSDELPPLFSLEALPEGAAGPANRAYVNLFHSQDWRTIMLGRWVIHDTQFCFQDGAFVKAIKDGSKQIIVENLPESDELMLFLHQAKLKGGFFNEGEWIVFDEDITLYSKEGYDWESLLECVSINEVAVYSPNTFTLNPSSLNLLYTEYVCDKEKESLNEKFGYLKENTSYTLTITRDLTDDDWAQLFDYCLEKNIQLSLQCTGDIELTDTIKNFVSRVELNSANICSFEETFTSLPETSVIISDDIDISVAQLTEQLTEPMIIDVSECESSDLLSYIDGKLDAENLRFHFYEHDSLLLNSLSVNRDVILKGNFSEELIDKLAPLLLARSNENENDNHGRLIVVSEHKSGFEFIPHIEHNTTLDDKRELLEKNGIEIPSDNMLNSHSWVQLQAVHRAQLAGFENPFKGLEDLPVPPPLDDINFETVKNDTDTFVRQRLDKVERILTHSPFVFLAGLTGVGKTSFVEYFWQNENRPVYFGKSELLDWINDESDGLKTLFIDEATLDLGEWSLFEGLFNDPPAILINGEYRQLDKNHKVIFAANPVSYGDERHLARLFKRHGNAVIFSPLPLSYIYHFILKPLFENTELESYAELCSETFLEIYQFICTNSHDKIEITARELASIALLTINYCQNNPEADVKNVARYYAYEIAAPLVPNSSQKDFENRFACEPPLRSLPTIETPDFIMTPSREPLAAKLSDMLNLRQWRRAESSQNLNKVQKYGGLGGIIIEGKPGIGKSQLVLATLNAHGLEEEKDFYCMPVSMSVTEKEALLLKAFDNGAIVIVDEINSSPMMERLLNCLLMGKKPDGTLPTHPGFGIIGTQNPATMQGRRAASTALNRRLRHYELAPYPREELIALLQYYNLPTTIAANLTEAFLRACQYARANKLSPEPCFRDLLKIAQQLPANFNAEFNAELNAEFSHYADLLRNDRPKISFFRSAAKKSPPFALGGGLMLAGVLVQTLSSAAIATTASPLLMIFAVAIILTALIELISSAINAMKNQVSVGVTLQLA